MDSVRAIESLNDRNSEIEDELDSCTDDKVCVYETEISEGGYIKQEPYDVGDEPGNIDNYVDIKDDKAYVYETVMNGGYIKGDPYDTTDLPRDNHNYATIKDEIIEDSTVVKQEIECTTSIKGNYLTCCEECDEEYDLYCLKCPMLIRIFNKNNPDLNNSVRRTLPKNFVDMFETESGVGIVALRVIPKGVVFGPFERLDLTVSKSKLKNEDLAYVKDPECLNWMQYIQRVDQSSHPNLSFFQYQDELYYRSDCHISVGDELLVYWDCDGEESVTEGSCFKPRICENLDDVYACMLCCVGYRSVCHLEAHNSRCPQKRNKNDFCKEVIQCRFCKIYMDEKEYSDYHIDGCFERKTKISAMHEDDKPFRCTQCTFKTKTNKRLKLHMASHSDDKPFACSICSFKTTTNARLKAHMAVHNDSKPIACSLCSYKTKTKCQLKEHMSIHTDVKPFACLLCSFKTRTRTKLKLHMVIHSDDKPFACTQCPFKTKRDYQLKRHMVSHNDDKPFACPLCSVKTWTSTRLKVHMVIHNDDKLYACTQCPYITKTNSQLNKHIVKHNEDKPFACSICSYKARTNSQLKTHLGIHQEDKALACTICSFKTTTSSRLAAHIIIHNDDKPFVCTQCPFKTKTDHQLKLHMAIHSDDKPFACSFCSFKTAISGRLKRHIATHDEGKSFACTQCSFETTTNWRLKLHIATHNDD